ncbi:disulfide bond formation protein DsbB [Mesorhizobium sp. J18]|uniref:disulfide bond formation protein B n=1 Tax=Mesorhizobium sp. J18 TaxID=935263 RepID=UPI00119C68EA|nr:disulfide bond formation protein B [Mesorhizobium sp. J18]TWG91110.1 disulfide bond formation protein DsbB [Mesorhizobium sp. J18]
MRDRSVKFLNALALLGISALLAFAFADQIIFSDLPCPLCILQRLGFALAGFGFALNLIWGTRYTHYALIIFASVVGATVAGRQVLLHIIPGSGTYGEPLFGLHFYTWAFIAFVIIIIWCGLLLAIDHQLLSHENAASGLRESGSLPQSVAPSGKLITALPASIFALLIGLNALSTFVECSTGICPADPSRYELLP